MNIVQELFDGHQKPQKRFAMQSGEYHARLVDRRFAVQYPHITPSGRRVNPECEVCSKKSDIVGTRHRTDNYCTDCKMPLCAFPCFMRYNTVHTVVHYKVKCTPELLKQ